MRSSIAGYFLGAAAVALITLFYQREAGFAITTIVLTYLLAILIASSLWGLGVSVFMSAAAALALDYFFFPPIGRFAIADPQNWLILIAFLITSVIGSDLHARARRQTEEARLREYEVEQLYQFSRRLLKEREPLEVLLRIPNQIVESFHVEQAALYFLGKEEVHRSERHTAQLDEIRLKAAAAGDWLAVSPGGPRFVAIRNESGFIGSFGISSSAVSDRTLDAIATLIAATVDRAQATDRLGKAEAAQESERLKSVFLDAIAHDFKTPLTSIKAAATSLLDDLEFNRSQRGELLEVIDEECDRINAVIGQAIEMAQLDAGAAKLKPAPHFLRELLAAVLDDFASMRTTRPIRTEVHREDAQVSCDLYWTRKMLGHLIRNADLYSSPREPITIRTEMKNDFVIFNVSDVGPGIEESEIDHIFDKFYRGKGQRHRVPGTGMGLAVAKAIVEAQGGTIRAASEVGRGSTFSFSLPVAPAKSGTR